MKIKFTFLFFITCLPFIIIAQNIKGTVTDATKSPLIGVSILLKGTNTGTVTDLDGNFSIDAKSGVLVFSYIGYITQEINISGKQDLIVQLEEDNKVLNTLVVVGYDLQKKKEITSSVVVIDEKALKDRPMVSAAEALQGKAAGVQVTQPSGKPGGDIAVRVRGATSVLAGNEPLYVVDGVPTTDIRGLNPIDILTMTVLKDASSSAIYGARAANGVVLISTKRGKADAPVARFNTYYGVSYLRKTIDVLTTKKYRELMVELNPNNIDVITSNNSDWSSQVFGQGNIQNYQLSYSGGTEKSRYFVSGGYLDNNGIIKPSKFNRYSIRMNLDNQLNTWLKLTTNVNLLQSKTKDTPDNASSGRGGVIMSALNTPPFLRVYKADGSGWFDPNPFQPSWENPIAYMQGADQLVTDTRVFGNISAEANIIENLTAKSSVGIDLNNHVWDYYLDPFRTTYGRSQNGIGRSDKNSNNTWLWENTLLYKASRGNHNYSLLAGSSLQKNNYNDTYLEGYDFPKDTKVRTLNAANVVTGSSQRTEWALASFFGRFTYDYKSTYLLTASFRRDGSSKLSNPWGTMPAISAGWRISEEKFLKNVKNLDDLKLRIGWGINGNQEGISPYAKFGLVSYNRRTPTNPLSGPAFAQTSYGNPDLKWETTAQTNIGFDLTMFKSRMQLAIDLYNKNTKDVLLNVQLPSSLPINTIQTNAGEINNKGIDINLSTANFVGDFKWNSDFNISFNKNEVKSLKYTDIYYYGRIYSNNQDVSLVKKGYPLGTFFGYVSEGVDPETGNMKYKDVNNNGIFDPGDRTSIGNGQPLFTFGFTNNFSYKRFSLDVFFQGSYGNDIFNASRIDLEGMFDSKNQSTAVLRRWTTNNRNTDIPKIINDGNLYNVNNSSRFVEDGSYLRLKAVTLSYDFNMQKIKAIKKLSVYATAQNLLTFTKYSGFDPEVNAFGRSATELGIDYGTYPQSISMIFGANIEF